MFSFRLIPFFFLCLGLLFYTVLHGEKKELNEAELKTFFKHTHGIAIGSENNLALYQEVYRWLGTPYKDFGTDENGIDCSSFTSKILSRVYSSPLSGPSYTMYPKTNPISKEELKEGDLIFFTIYGDKISHVGVYLKDKKFVHASVKRGVTINSLEEAYYQKYYTASGRL
ncbi:C40 family peptidase [Leptospira yasudae]|uniref:C40 family peptidase n=1 Tax=Leptospira yasudae TaxID=2202201 RepID=UPI001C4F18D1|nr:C40 family peptidase [Leptospira yasudae]MBW0435179.1 C40 family peptidase [Leptospira yasudae]